MNGRRSERGYNLIEVLIAMAIFGVVIIAIGSLFVWGRRNVYSGKQMTTAVSIGTRVLEDLAPLSRQDVYLGVFDIAAGTAGEDVTFGFPEVTYENAAVRSTNDAAVAGYADIQLQRDPGPKLLDKWAAQLVQDHGGGVENERLTNGSVTLIMMPRRDTVSPERFGNAAVLQLRVIVQWQERTRTRQLVLDTVKAN